jgi:hypothetical protein
MPDISNQQIDLLFSGIPENAVICTEIGKPLIDLNHINPREIFEKMQLSENERERVEEEIFLFEQANAEILLKFIIWLSDFVRKNNIPIGVGRGSSCSLYTLYLLGLHHVNCLKYNISCLEFFKIKEVEQEIENDETC